MEKGKIRVWGEGSKGIGIEELVLYKLVQISILSTMPVSE